MPTVCLLNSNLIGVGVELPRPCRWHTIVLLMVMVLETCFVVRAAQLGPIGSERASYE